MACHHSSQGAYNIEAETEQLLVTPLDPSFVTLFAQNCSCGGTWKLGVTRNIFKCKGCNLEFLSSFDFYGGGKAYGNILAYQESIRFVEC